MVHARRRHPAGGQALVETALTLPVALLIIYSILAGSYLFFQYESVSDGARGGSRAASIEQGLAPGGPPACESGTPSTIVAAVQHSTTIVAVNPAPLCAVSTTRMVQRPTDPKKVNITVDIPAGQGDLQSPRQIAVTVTYIAGGLAPPFAGSFTFTSTSTVPVLNP